MGKQRAIAEWRRNPLVFGEGLGTIAANLRRLVEGAIEAGASGIFFSCMGATTADFTREEYLKYALPYDAAALEGAAGGWLNIVHVHADPTQTDDQLYFDIFTDYPVSVMSWSDRLTGPTLTKPPTITLKSLMAPLPRLAPPVPPTH